MAPGERGGHDEGMAEPMNSSSEHDRTGTDEVATGGFETALGHISEAILNGVYRAGSRLPAERAFAVQLGVSRGAVREAFKVLQAQGIITSGVGPGQGTRIAAQQGSAFGRMLRLHLALHSTTYDDLTETRILLERGAAASAARVVASGKADPEVLQRVRDLTSEMERNRDAEPFNALDTAFHVGIAELGENLLVRDLTVAIRESVASTIRQAEAMVPDWEAFRAELVEEHRMILAAIEAGDPSRASQATEDHIRSAHSVLLPQVDQALGRHSEP